MGLSLCTHAIAARIFLSCQTYSCRAEGGKRRRRHSTSPFVRGTVPCHGQCRVDCAARERPDDDDARHRRFALPGRARLELRSRATGRSSCSTRSPKARRSSTANTQRTGSGSNRSAWHLAHTTSPALARPPAMRLLRPTGLSATRNLRPRICCPVLDLEDTGGLGSKKLKQWTKAWLAEVQAKLGVKAIIYTGPSFWKNAMGNTTWFADNGYPLWIAHYTPNPRRPYRPPTGEATAGLCGSTPTAAPSTASMATSTRIATTEPSCAAEDQEQQMSSAVNPARGRLVVLGIGGSGGRIEDRSPRGGRARPRRALGAGSSPPKRRAQAAAQIVHRSVGQRDVGDGLRTLRDHV